MDAKNKTNEATVMHVRTDLGMGGEDEIELVLVPVAVETDYNSDGSLKAYWVQFVDDEWGMFIHAVSVGKAKSLFWNSYPGTDYPEWNDIRATRCRGADLLDKTPFTDDTLRFAGYDIPKPDDENYVADAFLHDCPCSMCKFELTKPGYQVGNKMQMAEVQ